MAGRYKRRNQGSGGIGPDGARTKSSPPRPTFGAKQTVKGGVKKRALRRSKAVGKIPGVKTRDGITGREARKIRNQWLDEGRPKPQKKPKPSRPKPRDPYAQEVNAAAKLQYAPQERELAQQGLVEQQRGVNQNAWYTQHYQRALQAAQAQQAGYQAAQQMAYTQGNQQFGQDTAANQQLMQQQQQQAAIRGTTVDPAVAQQANQGAQVRQQGQAQFGNLIGSLGANEAAYGQTRTLQASEQGIQAQADTQARQRKVESLTRELLADKGAFKQKVGQELRDTAHKQRLENKAFGLDVVKEQFDQADTRADNRRMSKAERRQQREARSRMRDRRKDNYRADRSLSLAERREQRMRDQDLADDGKVNNSSGGAGGKSSFTPTQIRSGRRELRNYISRGKKGADLPDSHDPLLARAAAQVIKNGGVSPDLARKIRRQYGFTPKIRRRGPHDIGAKPSPLGPK